MPEQLEPGVNTTPSPADSAANGGGAEPQAGAAGAKERAAPPRSPSAAGAAPTDTASAKATAQGRAAQKGPDRLQLDTTEITGNRELPKVLYIVPWKRSDLGDLMGRPVNSLLDEVLQPLDRDVFQRENRYYNDLKPPTAGAKEDSARGPESKP